MFISKFVIDIQNKSHELIFPSSQEGWQRYKIPRGITVSPFADGVVRLLPPSVNRRVVVAMTRIVCVCQTGSGRNETRSENVWLCPLPHNNCKSSWRSRDFARSHPGIAFSFFQLTDHNDFMPAGFPPPKDKTCIILMPVAGAKSIVMLVSMAIFALQSNTRPNEEKISSNNSSCCIVTGYFFHLFCTRV